MAFCFIFLHATSFVPHHAPKDLFGSQILSGYIIYTHAIVVHRMNWEMRLIIRIMRCLYE